MNDSDLERVAFRAAENTVQLMFHDKNKKRQKWLHNTKRLMEKYCMLKVHSKESVSRIMNTEIKDCINKLRYEDDNELIIDSIERSELRTYIMIQHTDKMLETLTTIYRRKNAERKCRALKMRYIEHKTYSEIAFFEGIDERTVYRDIDDALTDLSILIFGLESMV